MQPDVTADTIHYEKIEIESDCLYHLQSWQEGVLSQCWHWNAPVELPCDITVCDGKMSWCGTHAFFNKFLQLSAMISYSCMYIYWGKLMKDISRSAFQRCWRRRRDTAAKEIKSDQDQVGGGENRMQIRLCQWWYPRNSSLCWDRQCKFIPLIYWTTDEPIASSLV